MVVCGVVEFGDSMLYVLTYLGCMMSPAPMDLAKYDSSVSIFSNLMMFLYSIMSLQTEQYSEAGIQCSS